jgi:hypothetical protein
MSDKKQHSPNDERSIVKNPNNPAFEHDAANRSRQGQPAPATSPMPPNPQPSPRKKI